MLPAGFDAAAAATDHHRATQNQAYVRELLAARDPAYAASLGTATREAEATLDPGGPDLEPDPEWYADLEAG